MNYPDALCQLVIRNMEIVEAAPTVVAEVEKKFFAAVNDRISTAVAGRKEWKGCYDFVTDNDAEETSFAPESWPEDQEEGYLAWYTLYYMEEFEELNWLSCAIGLNGSSLCFCFGIDYKEFYKDAREYKKALENFYAENKSLQKLGFALPQDKYSIILPLHFDAEKLAGEYPEFDGSSLAPLDTALEILFKAHDEFDKFVKGLKKRK